MASSQELQERFNRIQQKEEELRKREAVLKEQQLGIDEDRPPNWPPCCPFIYHDITEEIPVKNATVVRVALWLQLVWAIALIVNMLACFGIGGMGSGESSNTQDAYPSATYIVYGIIYAVLGIPLAFRINYLKFYQQCKIDDLSGCWFFLELIFFGINVYAAVGMPESGLCGVLCAIDAISKGGTSTYLRVMAIITAIIFVCSALGQGFVGSKAFLLYKTMGGSFLTKSPIANQQQSTV